MGLSIFQNLAGTLRSTFRLGRSGPTLRQGTDDPNASQVAGNDGDVYIQCGTSAQAFYQRRAGYWVNISTPTMVRSTVTTPSYIVGAHETYIGINYNGPVNIYLPKGTDGRNLIIKDEGGYVSDVSPLTIYTQAPDTAEGSDSIVATVSRTSISLFFGGQWNII